MPCRALPFLLLLLPLATGATAQLVSGALIPSGEPGGLAPLALTSVVNHAVGTGHVFGNAQPDLFVKSSWFASERGFFVFPWKGVRADGVPIFGDPVPVTQPLGKYPYPPAGHVYEDGDGVIHGVWLDGSAVVHTRFLKDGMRFEETARVTVTGLPRGARNVVTIPGEGGALRLLLEVGDGQSYGPPEPPGGRDPEYRPYDGAGIWLGKMPYAGLYSVALPQGFAGPAETAEPWTGLREVRRGFEQLTVVQLGGPWGIVGGSRHGNLTFYDLTGNAAERRLIQGSNGIALRHPTIHPGPVAYPDPETGYSNLIAGGEGSLYFYRFTGNLAADGAPIYDAPVYALREKALLYTGSLPVPNVCDWDGDGDLDIVTGNSEGPILFFANTGSNAAPAFAMGIPLEAGGYPIFIQPGYRGDIQGPGEARWGYTCPAVVDWNADGLLDIVMSDSTATHKVYLNTGAPGAPRLAPAQPIYYDGIDLYGTWRVQPAAARLGDRMAYVALDDEDCFRLYWQVDAHNLEDGGQLRLTDDSVISANFIHAGGTGRLKLVFCDWDLDGVMDLLVATPRHGSVPNPTTGLPQSLGKGLPGSAVLWLRNAGSNAAPRFEFPRVFAFKGTPQFFGQHAASVAPADFNEDGKPELIIGREEGRLYYYAREDVSFLTVAECEGMIPEREQRP